MTRLFKLVIVLTIAVSLIFFSFPNAQAATLLTHDLAYGLRDNSEVRQLQDFLRGEDIYSGPATGNFFGLTRAAVIRFQIREGILPARGLVGPLTRARINELLGPVRAGGHKQETALNPSLLEQIQALQARLAILLNQQTAPATSTLAATATPTVTSTARATSTASVAPEKKIAPRSIVGLNCFFKYQPTGRIFNYSKGSGVIIRSDGVILTARHVVDLRYSYDVDNFSVDEDTAKNSILDHCDVGQIPAGFDLPDPDTIRVFNPTVQVPFLAYTAGMLYLPATEGASRLEIYAVDFALLKINAVAPDAPLFGVNQVPASFPVAELASSTAVKENDPVITYGYPGDVTTGLKSSFNTLYLTGSLGTVKKILYGDARFAGKPIIINTTMEVRAGRSGSPLFSKGYVLGIVSAHAIENVTDSFSVSASIISDLLKGVIEL